MVFVTPQTFQKMIKPLPEENVNLQPQDKSFLVRNFLQYAYGRGWSSRKFASVVSRQTVSRYLQKLVRHHGLDAGGRRITLNSLVISGRMNRIAIRYDFDIVCVLKRNDIPII